MLIYYIKTKVVKLTSLELRTKLVSQIIEKYGKDTENYRRGGKPSMADNPFQLVEQISLLMFHQQKKKLMPPNSVLFLEKVVSEKNYDMNVSGVMHHFALLLALKFIIKLRLILNVILSIFIYLYTYEKRTRNTEQ